MELNLFEQATRARLGFVTRVGVLNTEQLWSLPLQSDVGRPNLDDIAKDLNATMKEETTSFVEPEATNTRAKTAELMLAVVKRVIEVRVAERKAANEAKQKAETKQKIMGILAEKKDGELKNKSAEELEAMLATL